MKTKRINFTRQDEEYTMEEITPEDDLTKLASGGLSDEIKQYINENIEKHPDYKFVLVSAVGAGEIWGPNINGDYFPEKEIIEHHETFENMGHAFKQHENKNPDNAIGDILLSHWNEDMHRVELIVRLERAEAPRICQDIDNGKIWDVSMGCKVPYDKCSICGNKAYSTDDYCIHIKNKKNEVLPDGRKVYMINIRPRFFDISFVRIGADKTAKTLKKIASERNIEYNVNKEGQKRKEVPGHKISTDAAEIAIKTMREFEKLKEDEPELDREILDRLSEHNLPEILTTLFYTGIKLKPSEFLYIVCNKMGETPEEYSLIDNVPEEVYDRIETFRPLQGEIRMDIVKEVSGRLPERSSFRDYLFPRIVKMGARGQDQQKRRRFSPTTLATPGLMVGSALYKKYLDKVPEQEATGLDKAVKDKPWLLPLMTAGGIGAVHGIGSKRKAEERYRQKTSNMNKFASNLGGRVFAGVPAAHMASELTKQFDHDSKMLNFLEKHPNLVALLGVGATNTREDWARLKEVADELGNMSKTAHIADQINYDTFYQDIDMHDIYKQAKYIRENECDLGIPKESSYNYEIVGMKLFG